MRIFLIRSLPIAALSVAAALAQEPAHQTTTGAVRVPDVGVSSGAVKPGIDLGRTSRSSSRQFVVRAADGEVRSAFCVFSEQVKGEFLALLRQRDLWRFPVVIEVRGSSTAINVGRPVRSTIFKKPDGSFRLQATVDLGDTFSREEMRTELIRLLLAEEILRSHPGADLKGRAGVLPEWLRIGIAEAIEFRRRDRPTELFASIFKSGKMLSVTEMIHAARPESDSVSAAIYKASCCGFVLSLVGQNDGPTRLRKMIGDLAVFRGTQKALIEKHFPGNGESENSLEKWWSLELATMAQPTVKDILDPLATERALGLCLQVSFVEQGAGGEPDAGGRKSRKKFWQVFRAKGETADPDAAVDPPDRMRQVDLADYRAFIDRPDSARLLSDLEVKLLQLSYRAFPLHRSLIRDYQRALREIGRGKTRGVDDRLAELAAARIALRRSAVDATDYLNWYEATQVGQHSGAFTDYKEAVEELRRPPPPRRDPLSEYLDELDKEFR